MEKTNPTTSGPQVKSEHYYAKYDNIYRFCAYWTQIEWVLRLNEFPVLEIGVGNKVVNDYLSRSQIPTTSFDIAEDLHPNCVGSVHNLPFKEDSFGSVLVCQVLEHLPFEQFPIAVCELARVTRKYVIISLPNSSRACSISMHLPKIGKIECLLNLGWLFPHGKFNTTQQHYWEIGWRGFSLKKVIKNINNAGFNIITQFRIVQHPYYHYFVLEIRS